MNPTTTIDFYKSGHRMQYPQGTSLVYSNFTPRSDRLFNGLKDYWDGKVTVLGVQGLCKEFLIDFWNKEFFSKPKAQVIGRFKRRMDTSLGLDAVDVSCFEELHDLGYLPIEVRAIPEGERVNMKIPVLTIHNTDPRFFWIVNFLETALSCELWQMMTSATIAHQYRTILNKYAEDTGAPLDFVPLQGHDFSMRGVSGRMAAAQSGFGHLTSFVGTDTVPAIDYAEDYYNADAEKELIGCSVPATEHSVMCMGSQSGEKDTFRRLFTELYPTGIVSIVSDTWDYWKVITEYLPEFKNDILNRQPNALGLNKVVIRPDSGDPVHIICGYKLNPKTYTQEEWKDGTAERETGEGGFEAVKSPSGTICEMHIDESLTEKFGNPYIAGGPLTEAEVNGSIQCLWETFGGTETEEGYKVLDEHIGLIYGDSITMERADEILKRLKEKGFASCNVVFGIGSYTYQYNTRDTFGFAMKATYGEIDGEGREIFKDPATDKGTKKSARGLLRVAKEGSTYKLYDQQTWEEANCGELQTVFLNGKMVKETSLSEIRQRLWG